MNILITGGAGYIGSHTGLLLSQRGHQVEIVDNFSTGPESNIEILNLPCHVFEIADTESMATLLNSKSFDVILHFAGSAYVTESFEHPDKYYRNNVLSSLALLETLRKIKPTTKIIFSSSCATYGTPSKCPIDEDCPQVPISPYGHTKLIVEWMLLDYHLKFQQPYTILRYFNAAGCHPDGILGEHHEPETHLIPKMVKFALKKEPIAINGKNHKTNDGTCIRDYIHVWDLAMAHVLVTEDTQNHTNIFNLGIGRGYSILEIVQNLENILGYSLPIEWQAPRLGDPPELFANPSKAIKTLKWNPACSSMEQILQSTLQWFEKQMLLPDSAI
jgi:UDP-glucose-4-epimerase GalE